jgi:hypothetical protein
LGNIGRYTDKQWQQRLVSRPLTRANEICVGGKLDHKIEHIHRPAIPFQPETDVLLSDAIFRQRIGPQIVPTLAHQVSPLAHGPSLPPAELVSRFIFCSMCYMGIETIDSCYVLDMP